MDLKRYLAILREQRHRLEVMARVQGVVPLRGVYDALLATIAKGSGGGKMDRGQQIEIMQRARQAMSRFVRSGADVLNIAAAHVVTATAGQAFGVMSALERDRTGRPLIMSDRARDAIASAGPKPGTLIGAHQRSLARYGAHVVTRIDEQVSAGLALGETHTEVIDRVMGAADLEWYQADRIARTELSYAGNSAARAAIGKEHEILGDVYSQWTENADEDGRPLDDIVCVDSLALHGQIAGPGQLFVMPPTSVYPDARGRTEVPLKMIGMTWAHPPNRPNDRSVIGPWRPHWATPGWRWEEEARIDKRKSLEDAEPGQEEPASEEDLAAARRVQVQSAKALAQTQGEAPRGLSGRPRQPPDAPAVPGAAPRRASVAAPVVAPPGGGRSAPPARTIPAATPGARPTLLPAPTIAEGRARALESTGTPQQRAQEFLLDRAKRRDSADEAMRTIDKIVADAASAAAKDMPPPKPSRPHPKPPKKGK